MPTILYQFRRHGGFRFELGIWNLASNRVTGRLRSGSVDYHRNDSADGNSFIDRVSQPFSLGGDQGQQQATRQCRPDFKAARITPQRPPCRYDTTNLGTADARSRDLNPDCGWVRAGVADGYTNRYRRAVVEECLLDAPSRQTGLQDLGSLLLATDLAV